MAAVFIQLQMDWQSRVSECFRITLMEDEFRSWRKVPFGEKCSTQRDSGEMSYWPTRWLTRFEVVAFWTSYGALGGPPEFSA
jgi:hypothetical protein